MKSGVSLSFTVIFTLSIVALVGCGVSQEQQELNVLQDSIPPTEAVSDPAESNEFEEAVADDSSDVDTENVESVPLKTEPAKEPVASEKKPISSIQKEETETPAPTEPSQSEEATEAEEEPEPVAQLPETPAPNPQEEVETAPDEVQTPETPEPPLNTDNNAGDHWTVSEAAAGRNNPVEADEESLEIGKSLYVKHCRSCHGKFGEGDGSKSEQLDTECPNFTEESFKNQTDGSLFFKIWQGRDEMPAYKKKLDYEEDTWHIINYLRTL